MQSDGADQSHMRKLTPFRIVVLYVMFGSLWILFSDLAMSALVQNSRLLTSLSIVKGWLYVGVTSLILYWVLKCSAGELKETTASLHKAEERFRSFAGTTGEWLWEIDREGRFTYSSPAVEKVLGYQPDEMIGKTNLSFIQSEDQKRAREMFAGMLAEKKGWTDFVLQWTSRDRTVRFLKSTAVPIFDAMGEVAGFRGSDHDMTDQKRTENALIKNEQLESLGILAGGISHEFNNVLTAIMGNIALVKMKLVPEDPSFRRLEEMEKASLRAQDLAEQLIAFARESVPVRKTVSLEQLIRHYSSFALRGTGVTVEFNFAEGLWPVEVDEGQIGLVFNHLVMNACQAMPRGGKISISAENTIVETEEGLPLKYGYYVKTTFTDQGTGIPAEQLHKIFDPGFTTRQKRSGLGLAISYSILRNHDGHITVSSEIGSGTTFTIYLPYSRKELIEKSSAGERHVIGKGRVLLMDDEEMVRSVGGAILRELGYQVEFAHDGDEAVRLYRTSIESAQPFDAVILDLTVSGGMGGRETIRKLRAFDPEIKAIVSSGYSDDPIMTEFSEYGFRDVIPKPYDSINLSKILHRVITGT